jgi:hypothetical protein
VKSPNSRRDGIARANTGDRTLAHLQH